MTPHFNITRFYLLTSVFYLMAFNYCREEALKCDFGKKNLEFADLRDIWDGALPSARQPNGVAVNGSG